MLKFNAHIIMTNSITVLYANIEAIKAEIEGMKSENKLREQQGNSPAYGEGSFYKKAEEIRSHLSEYFKYS